MPETPAAAPRSGDAIQTISLVSNLLMTVLAPFVTWWIASTQTRYPGLQLPSGYDATVLLLISTIVNQAAQYARMWYIRRAERPPERLNAN